MASFDEINELSRILKRNLRECAYKSAAALDLEGKNLYHARKHFLSVITEVEEYAQLERLLEVAYDDCMQRYKMERWWVVSALGVDLRRELLTAFDDWWKTRK